MPSPQRCGNLAIRASSSTICNNEVSMAAPAGAPAAGLVVIGGGCKHNSSASKLYDAKFGF